MGLITRVLRDQGHPWGAAITGWDGMFIWADNEVQFERAQLQAEGKFWRLWIKGRVEDTPRMCGYFYKPSGASAPWEPPRKELDFFVSPPG